MTIEELVATYGYFGIVLGGVFECEVAAVAGGLAAQSGLLRLPWVIVAVTATGIVGDGLYFALGRTLGAKYLARRPSLVEKVRKARDALVRHQVLVILAVRFMWGIRAPMSFAIGMSPIPLHRFVLLGLVSSVVWAVAMTMGGYAFGGTLALILGDMQKWRLPIFWGVLGLAVIVVAVRAVMVRMRRGRADADRGGVHEDDLEVGP